MYGFEKNFFHCIATEEAFWQPTDKKTSHYIATRFEKVYGLRKTFQYIATGKPFWHPIGKKMVPTIHRTEICSLATGFHKCPPLYSRGIGCFGVCLKNFPVQRCNEEKASFWTTRGKRSQHIAAGKPFLHPVT